jgi:hypothetical protein
VVHVKSQGFIRLIGESELGGGNFAPFRSELLDMSLGRGYDELVSGNPNPVMKRHMYVH